MIRAKSVAAFFVAANALTAGSIFCFPLFGPKISADLGLSLTQTNTIWSAAVLGQYATAAVFGNIADVYGPKYLSLVASVLFGAGYILMAKTETSAVAHRQTFPTDAFDKNHQQNFITMAIYFFLVGAGVAASIFSALRSSTSHFKDHPGLALSIPLTLFSLSSLFLSAFASLAFFQDAKTGDLDSPKFLSWLGAVLMITNALSALGLSVPGPGEAPTSVASSESTSLLPRQATTLKALPFSVPYYRKHQDASIEPRLNLVEYLASPSVWILASILFAAVGGAEMVMGSIGSMVVSLRASQSGSISGTSDGDNVRLGKETLALRTQQVQLLAIANTIARFAVGLLSDAVCPQPLSIRSTGQRRRQTSRIPTSRLTFVLFALVLLLVTFAYAAFALNDVDRLWIVSLATGAGYGLTCTLVPSIVICVWPAQFGRNYGILTYASALGALTFSMLFAKINDVVAVSGIDGRDAAGVAATVAPTRSADVAICKHGRQCFTLSFQISVIALFLATLAVLPLWRRWRKYL